MVPLWSVLDKSTGRIAKEVVKFSLYNSKIQCPIGRVYIPNFELKTSVAILVTSQTFNEFLGLQTFNSCLSLNKQEICFQNDSKPA